jgi:hypothetical protein
MKKFFFKWCCLKTTIMDWFIDAETGLWKIGKILCFFGFHKLYENHQSEIYCLRCDKKIKEF